MPAGVAVFLWTVKSNRLNGFMGPEGSWIGVKCFEKACKISVKQYEHDSDKSSILISQNNNKCESSDKHDSRVDHQRKHVKKDVKCNMFTLLKCVNNVMAQLEKLMSPEIVHYDVENYKGDEESPCSRMC